MSRSYKKTPAFTDTGKKFHHFAKRQANVAVRRFKGDLSNGRSYKKLFETWDICDYKCIYNPRKYRVYIEKLWARFDDQDPRLPDVKRVMWEIRSPRVK